MKISVSISVQAEDQEKNVSYQNISYTINGFGRSVSVRDLKETIDNWLKKQPTRIEDELKETEEGNA